MRPERNPGPGRDLPARSPVEQTGQAVCERGPRANQGPWLRTGNMVFWQHPSEDEIVAFPLEVQRAGATSLVLAHK
jgi:hypothetical protein